MYINLSATVLSLYIVESNNYVIDESSKAMGDDDTESENEVGDDYAAEPPMKSNDQGFDMGKYI